MSRAASRSIEYPREHSIVHLRKRLNAVSELAGEQGRHQTAQRHGKRNVQTQATTFQNQTILAQLNDMLSSGRKTNLESSRNCPKENQLIQIANHHSEYASQLRYRSINVTPLQLNPNSTLSPQQAKESNNQ